MAIGDEGDGFDFGFNERTHERREAEVFDRANEHLGSGDPELYGGKFAGFGVVLRGGVDGGLDAFGGESLFDKAGDGVGGGAVGGDLTVEEGKAGVETRLEIGAEIDGEIVEVEGIELVGGLELEGEDRVFQGEGTLLKEAGVEELLGVSAQEGERGLEAFRLNAEGGLELVWGVLRGTIEEDAGDALPSIGRSL